MNTRLISMIVGIVLVLGGGYVLLEGGAITSRETVLDVGKLTVSAAERDSTPPWLAGLAIAVGAVRLIGGIAVTFSSALLSTFDSETIRPEAGAKLQQIAKSLAEYPNSSRLIVGPTDAVGTAAYNTDAGREGNRRIEVAIFKAPAN